MLTKINYLTSPLEKSAAEETKKFLLNVRKLGKSLQEKFIKECNEDPGRFEKPVSRQKMKTFVTELKKVKVRGSNEKTAVSTMMRDRFGFILCVALEKKVDMADILTYPNTCSIITLSFGWINAKNSKNKIIARAAPCLR